MNAIGKFISDVEKIKKHDRQNNNGNPDYNRFAKNIRSLFERSSICPKELAGSVFEYWENEYILNSANILEEPSQEHASKLSALLSFLNNADEDLSELNDKDWQELGKLVSYESEDLPIDLLQDLMKLLVDKKAY